MPFRRLLHVGALLAMICYPFAVHSSIIMDSMIPGIAALLLFLGISGLLLLAQHRWFGGVSLMLLTLLAGGLTWFKGASLTLLHVPPIAINLMLAGLFASTLLPGRVPLITHFAATVHEQALDQATRDYTRRVTQLWVTVFFIMAIESWLLAMLASHAVWSLFTNFINYLIVLLVFMFEYRVRIRRLAQLEHPGFFRFLFSLRKLDMRGLLGS